MLDWQSSSPKFSPPPALAILPIGALEQHGPHLPIGCDAYFAGEISREIARELDAWLLPTMPYSNSLEHMAFPGTVTLRPATLAMVITDIVDSLGCHGVNRLAIVNFHGGNWVLKSAIREINRLQDKVMVLLSQPYEGVPGLKMNEDLHAGDFETSLMLHALPDLVGSGAVDNVPDASPERLDQLGMKPLCPDGIWGNATQADAARGKRDLAWMVGNGIRQIRTAIAEVEAFGGQG